MSELAKNELLANLDQALGRGQDVEEALRTAYRGIEDKFFEAALKAYQVGFGKVARVGSCALVAVVKGRTLTAANVGDCRGILVEEDGEPRQINREHNAAREEEMARLRAEFPDDKDIVVCKTARACYVKGRLQPTRALGDFHLKYEPFNNP